MKIFLSWSGERSRAVAELLRDWIRCVLQASRPWISSRDIDRGAIWFNAINDQLSNTAIGIVCLTQENKQRPWILFESGALAKGLSAAGVCTFLVDLQPKDVEDPLAQFNHTLPTKEGLSQLVETLNRQLGDAALDDRVLQTVFETYWPQFEREFADILTTIPASAAGKPREDTDVLAEILANTRQLSVRVSHMERASSSNDKQVKDSLPRKELSPLQVAKLVRELVASGMADDAITERVAMDGGRPSLAKEMLTNWRNRDSEDTEVPF